MSDEFYNPDPPSKPAAGSRVRSLFTGLIFIGLLGAVGYLLSERNHRSYSVVREGNSLIIMRGLMLPFGSEAYHPSERALAEAYGPIPIQNDSTGDLLTKTYSERGELDRELFRTLASWINARLTADDSAKLKEAVTYLRRAEKLSDITDDERKQLDEIRAETGFYEGRAKLDEGLEALSDSLEKLELAAGSKSRHAREASALLLQIQEPVRAAIRATRVGPTAASLLVPSPPPAIQAPTDTVSGASTTPAPAVAGTTPAPQPSAPKPAEPGKDPFSSKAN
jgi:hypothetical protein